MSGERARPAVTPAHRSVHPKVAGVPWWGAVLIAVTATAIGFAFDAGAGTKELTNVFAALYVMGCVAAVLTVRQAGLFSAVVQPPVLLFISVPGAYFLFHGAEISGVKDILINCGYPLIERFPLMLFTSSGVLVIGLIRWYRGRHAAAGAQNGDVAEPTAGRLSGLVAKLSALFSRSADEQTEADREATGRPRHAKDRPAAKTAAKTGARAAGKRARRAQPARTTRTRRRTEPARSRRTLSGVADVTEIIQPVVDRPRRTRTTPREEPPFEPRRRRAATGREGLRSDPYAADPYAARDGWRSDPYARRERRTPRDGRSRYDTYERFEPYEPPPRRRPPSNGHGNGANGTHHPISRVRYRDIPENGRPNPENGRHNPENGRPNPQNGRPNPPARPRPRSWQGDAWDYDI